MWNCFSHEVRTGPNDDSIKPDSRMKEMWRMREEPKINGKRVAKSVKLKEVREQSN